MFAVYAFITDRNATMYKRDRKLAEFGNQHAAILFANTFTPSLLGLPKLPKPQYYDFGVIREDETIPFDMGKTFEILNS